MCDLTAGFALTGPTASHHLKVHYRAVPDAMRQLSAVLMPAEQPAV